MLDQCNNLGCVMDCFKHSLKKHNFWLTLKSKLNCTNNKMKHAKYQGIQQDAFEEEVFSLLHFLVAAVICDGGSPLTEGM